METKYYSIVTVKEDILVDNTRKADELRQFLTARDIYLINIMASPGSGKTTLLTNLINKMKEHYHIGVLEADIDVNILENENSYLKKNRSGHRNCGAYFLSI